MYPLTTLLTPSPRLRGELPEWSTALGTSNEDASGGPQPALLEVNLIPTAGGAAGF